MEGWVGLGIVGINTLNTWYCIICGYIYRCHYYNHLPEFYWVGWWLIWMLFKGKLRINNLSCLPKKIIKINDVHSLIFTFFVEQVRGFDGILCNLWMLPTVKLQAYGRIEMFCLLIITALRYFTEFDSFAAQLRHSDWRYNVRRISSPSYFGPKLTHPAARSVSDSWATCYFHCCCCCCYY